MNERVLPANKRESRWFGDTGDRDKRNRENYRASSATIFNPFEIEIEFITNALCTHRVMPDLLTNRSMTTSGEDSARMHSGTILRISARASLVSSYL